MRMIRWGLAGTGAISRQIVEAHRGTIRAENRLGPPDESGEPRRLGARFVIRLPVVSQKG